MAILIVDDESESRTLLTTMLVENGYEVRAADGGNLALATIGDTRPNLILLDIRMPGMNGFEVYRELKMRVDTQDIPVIFITASGASEEKVEGLRLGAVDYVTKPFQCDELVARVRTHLELSRLRRHLKEEVEKRTAELRESEERFRNMANAAPVMIWTSGTDKRFTFVNKRWMDFTGRSSEQELGNGWADNVHPDDVERCCAAYSSSFDAHQPFTMEYRMCRADGEYRWILNSGVPRFEPDGVFEGYVGSCIDITDLKQTHEKMLASQKLESLGLMAAGVAHDFGNLLGAILAEIDLARMDMSAKAPGRKNIDRIEAAVTHATGIVKLLMASAGAGGVSKALEAVNLSFVVEEILRLLKVSISKRAVVRSNLTNDLPPVIAAVAEIRQVVMNLITNAVEAVGDQQGSITITTEGAHLGPGSRGDYQADLPDGDYVRLKVADTGVGMNAETQAKIFDQFFTSKPYGRGLGLSVVHGIVRSHRGAINVVSTAGKGTTFEVLLPCVSTRSQT
jgi:two-component system, cell cycle sensor histidine kinase and response regulator CckA